MEPEENTDKKSLRRIPAFNVGRDDLNPAGIPGLKPEGMFVGPDHSMFSDRMRPVPLPLPRVDPTSPFPVPRGREIPNPDHERPPREDEDIM